MADAVEVVTHTPGPWHVSEKGFSRKRPCPTVYATDDELRYIAECSDFANQVGRETDNLANARLISAAPDLFAAVRAVFDKGVRHEDGDGLWIPPEVFNQLDDAFTKAKGA